MMSQPLHSPQTPYPCLSFLFEALVAPVKQAVMETAITLDMAHILSSASTVDDIANKAGIQTGTQGLICFLDALVAVGLANKENGKYSNTDTGRYFFDKTSPVYMGDYIQDMKSLVQKNLAGMADIVKHGMPDLPETESWQNESRWERAVANLALGQRAGMAAIYADLVEELLQFSRIKKILDLGGGPGLIGAQILGRIPGATGVLMDLPAVIGLARQEIEKEGMADRISFIAGDYNETDLGSGYDLIWASHNLYFVKDRVPFFKRVKTALAEKGVFVCLHEGLVQEQTAPADIILMRLSSAIETVSAPDGQNYAFNKAEIAGYLKQAGFNRVESRMVHLPSGEAELVVAS